MVIDASVHGEWVYIDILAKKVVTNMPEPTKSKKWDWPLAGRRSKRTAAPVLKEWEGPQKPLKRTGTALTPVLP